MACHFNENVYTTVFTPREYQVELLDTARKNNTIVCLGHSAAKVFVPVKLLQELATEVRRPNGKRSLFLLDAQNVNIMGLHIRNLTDLNVAQFDKIEEASKIKSEDWNDVMKNNQVLVMTSEVCLSFIKCSYFSLIDINLLVIDDCKLALSKNFHLRQLLKEYPSFSEEHKCRILGLTTTVLTQNFEPARLEAEFEHLETILHSKVDTASDIVTVLRYSSKPFERVLVCRNSVPCHLSEIIEIIVNDAKDFLKDHRYDLYEIYDEEYVNELREVPDPKAEPLGIIEDFLHILHTMGPWCADRAAFALLLKIEHLKVKTPYERHFLLLCMICTVMVKVRSICDDYFEPFTETERIYQFSTPRVLRLLELLRKFKPDTPPKVEVPANPTESEPKPTNTNNEENLGITNLESKTQVNANAPGSDAQGTGVVRLWKGRLPRGRKGMQPRARPIHVTDPDILCAIIFVEKRFSARVLYYLINELSHVEDDFSYLSVQYTVEKIADPLVDSREAETEHRKQEEVLKKFRMHECNLLIATWVLEEGIDVPKCNLVVRFDRPLTYNSYVQCKGRAKMPQAHYVLMTEELHLDILVKQLAQYIEIEKMLLKKCQNSEPSEMEEREADMYSNYIEPYKPENSPSDASVTISSAISLVNKYCAKLPSDTFTRLTPIWETIEVHKNTETWYKCNIRLPINSPLKEVIKGVEMPNRVLARRVAALQACRALHKIGELDDNLLPVGKESFRAHEEDWNCFPLEESDEILTKNNMEPRPGTTKRRQYYYKKVADVFTNCRPQAKVPAYLYLINMTLTCPLPEEQNTRGRKIYPPEDSAQGFGILTLKQIPKICPFPIFTRSGEVQVGLEQSNLEIIMTPDQLQKMMEFLNYIFTNVLRLQKYQMLFDPDASENSYLIVPTIRRDNSEVEVDWDFLNNIYENRNLTPHIIPEEERKDFEFVPKIYQDAVVMPWYRNQDEPQYFYVAEICTHLNPKSSFPGTDYKTFEEYYFRKYAIQIQNLEQPLLDVDHTSARLNFLTPRYVNRKGVALPTSSEETKRAKRENLEQKQILVPELCTVHPFPASLWRKAVCLPCILYRINALLLADQIRKQVAEELGLGQTTLPSEFEWAPLNFGWSLSDVLKKSKEHRVEKQLEIEQKPEPPPETETQLVLKEIVENETVAKGKDNGDDGGESENGEEEKDWMEIGTWSNEMASSCKVTADFDEGSSVANIGFRDNDWSQDEGFIRYGSPTSWMQSTDMDDYDTDDSCDWYNSEPESSEASNKSGGLRIEFKGDNVAEAIDVDNVNTKCPLMLMAPEEIRTNTPDLQIEASVEEYKARFQAAVEQNERDILSSDIIIGVDAELTIEKKCEEVDVADKQYGDLIITSLNAAKEQNGLEKQENSDEFNESIECCNQIENNYEENGFKFSFDYQPNLENHPGPSPSVILQALTMSNANDGINLERLETIGDSFLKYAITSYLYCTYDNIHEGKLSHLRSKQVSNLNLYRLGRFKVLGESMIATKFDPHDNWLPPCYYVPKDLEQALINERVPPSHWNVADMSVVKDMSKDEICELVRERGERLGVLPSKIEEGADPKPLPIISIETMPCFIPYNLITQHSIPDKSVADCVEALIGAYLIECGPRGALLFMAWLGIRVLPKAQHILVEPDRPAGSLLPHLQEDGTYTQIRYGELKCPKSPLLTHCDNPKLVLDTLLDGYDIFEQKIQYNFRDRSYLLQALTHASYSPNTVTDCYQRLEFLGDAILDYLITRHLYEDPRQHSPGALTDLRSALVNNTIFASLAVRHEFHKYFRHFSPGLHEVINRFVQIQEQNGHSINEEYYLIAEDESEEIEDVEVPKALGDVFESVAGAIFLDSGMSLDAVWKVYYRMMQKEIEQFSNSVPKSPIRELLELEPETAKFGKPEKLADGRRVRVTVEVFGKGTFKGIGRNYRIAKCTAAKCALKQLKKRGLIVRKN